MEKTDLDKINSHVIPANEMGRLMHEEFIHTSLSMLSNKMAAMMFPQDMYLLKNRYDLDVADYLKNGLYGNKLFAAIDGHSKREPFYFVIEHVDAIPDEQQLKFCELITQRRTMPKEID